MVDLFGVLTTKPDAEIAAVHPQAVPATLTTAEESDCSGTMDCPDDAATVAPAENAGNG